MSTPTYSGIELFDGNMNFLRKVAGANGHKDVLVQDGEEYLIWANAGDSTGENGNAALSNCRNGVVRIRLSDGEQFCLLADNAIQGKYAYAVHISGVDNKGWVGVSTFRSRSETPLTENANKLLKLRLDGSGFDVLQDFGPGVFDIYTMQPKASVSMDGKKVCWVDNGSVYWMAL